MFEESWDDLLDWDDRQVSESDGGIAICFGVAATVYFADGHAPEKRFSALECFEDYYRDFGRCLRWHSVGSELQRFSSTSKLKDRDMTPYLLSSKWDSAGAQDHAWAFYWHGGADRFDASPFRIYCYGSPRAYAELDGSLSFLQLSVSISAARSAAREFVSIVGRCCQRLDPVHGYGGLTIIDSPDRGRTQRHALEIAGFAARHPGLEVDRPMSHKLATVNRIKGGNWLTILSDRFVEELGGIEQIRSKLGEGFDVILYRTGVLVVAGTAPMAGDRNRKKDVPLYRHLAEVLKPIRTISHPAVYPRGPFSQREEFEAWLQRFDS